MELKPAAVPESLSTLSAYVRLLPGVDAEVSGKRARVAEAHGADGAGVRPLARVDA